MFNLFKNKYKKYTLDYYKHVVDFCKKNEIILMSDVAYSDMYFDEKLKFAGNSKKNIALVTLDNM